MTARSLLCSRTELSLSALQLWQPGTYTVVGDSFGPGAQVLRRDFVTSKYVKGRTLLNAVEDSQTAVCTIEVGGTSGSDLEANIGILLAAVKQSSYTLAAIWDDVPMTWLCEPADSMVGSQGVLEDVGLKFHTAVVSLFIPRSPVPSVGTF